MRGCGGASLNSGGGGGGLPKQWHKAGFQTWASGVAWKIKFRGLGFKIQCPKVMKVTTEI